jgi:hypothetical protein
MGDDPMKAYSSGSGKEYDSWEDLVAAEANGYVAVAIITHGKMTWPWVVGPFPDKAAAQRGRVRLRRKMNRERGDDPSYQFSLFVRPVWKDES